jgi:hypothetical protein
MTRTWPVEDLARHRVLWVVGDVVIRHDHDVIRTVAATEEHLVGVEDISLVPAGAERRQQAGTFNDKHQSSLFEIRCPQTHPTGACS